MIRAKFLTSFLSVLLFSATVFAQQTSSSTVVACPEFSFKFKTTQDLSTAEADLVELKTIYRCVLDRHKADMNGTVSDPDVMKEALKIDNSAVKFDAELRTAGAGQPAYNRTTEGAKLDPILNNVAPIITNSRKIASATYQKHSNNIQNLSTSVNSLVPDTDLHSNSLLAQMKTPRTDNKTSEDILKSKVTDLAVHKAQIASLELPVPAPKPPDPPAPTPVVEPSTKKTDDGKTDDGKTDKNDLKDYLDKEALNKRIKELEDAEKERKKSTTPAATTASANASKSGSGGGSGSGGFLGIGKGSQFQNDEFREKLIEEAKKRADKLRRQDLQKATFGDGKSGSSRLQAPKMDGGSILGSRSGSSLRDLFSKKDDEETTPTSAPKRDYSSMFAGATGKDGTPSSSRPTGDYREYFKDGASQYVPSSRDLAMSNFSSMYETARRRALTQGSDKDYAGRYVDLFMLVNTVLDNEYRGRGKLMDLSEVVPSPI